MSQNNYDAIVIGAGHNGLTNATYLARSGLKVLLLERNPWIGGAAVSREIEKGWTYSNCSYVCSLLRPEIFRDLQLARHGLQVVPYGGGVTITSKGDILGGYADHELKRREYARHNAHDGDAYDRYSTEVMRQCKFIRPLLMRTPPDPTSLRPRDIKEMIFLSKEFKKLGEQVIYDTIRFYSMSIADYLGEFFESDLIKAALSGSGIIGTALGPYSPGTAYVLLHHYMGEIDGAFRSWGLSRGGTGAISNAIASAAREAGVEIRSQAPVSRILVKDGAAVGVVLENGDYCTANVVSSSLDPRQTFSKLVGEEHLPADFVEDVRRYKYRGSSGKVNLALDALPDFTCLPGPGPHLRGAVSVSPSVDYMERAYDEAKYGRYSRRPYIDMVIPSLTDPSVAPPGKHVMSCFVQYAPYHLKEEGGWDAHRDGFGDTVIDTIAQYAPNIKDIILHRQVLTPLDIERDFGLSEGNIFQGELTLEQLFFLRPAPGWAQYKTPVRNLYMCGSATHPGGGIMGAPGRNAALRILKETGKK